MQLLPIATNQLATDKNNSVDIFKIKQQLAVINNKLDAIFKIFNIKDDELHIETEKAINLKVGKQRLNITKDGKILLNAKQIHLNSH